MIYELLALRDHDDLELSARDRDEKLSAMTLHASQKAQGYSEANRTRKIRFRDQL
jgi:hypothetical protein